MRPALLCLALLSGCAGGAEPAVEDLGQAEVCGDLIDNDGDFAVDCDDIDCAGERGCAGRPETEKDCVNNVDDDDDGRTDCDDSDCASAGACKDAGPEICGDGADNDGNGLIDCADAVCKPLPECAVAQDEICTNERDDDGDGKTDCADPDCDTHPVCAPGREDCGNGRDDDGDGRADCDDDDCAGVCGGDPEDCDNGADDDQDGRTDCADPDCAADPACDEPPDEICTDGVDNDRDNRADCADPDCAGHPACADADPEDCDDGVDNDDDGRTDCDDPDCGADPACRPDPEDCGDGRDNDGDGRTDCDDADCAADPACQQTEPGSCADPLIGGVGVATGDTGDGADHAAPGCALGVGGLDAVYRVSFPQATTVCASTVGSDFDTVLYVQTTCGDTDSELACNDDGETLQSTLEFEAAAGVPYYVVVDGYNANYSGTYTLTLSDRACDVEPPAGACDDPPMIGEGSLTDSNAGATAAYVGSCGGADGAEVVFELSVDVATTVCADTNGTSYDTVMYVREAACEDGAEVACDDDGGDILESKVEFEAAAGVRYFVFVDAYDERGLGEFTLNVAFGPCP